VFTTDDRDPLRKLPRTLADLDGTLVDLGEVDAGALGRNLGAPYTDVPDPFGCCDSYGDHFSALIERSAGQLGVPIEVVSNTDLYADGTFEPVTRELLANADAARDALGTFQDKVDGAYVPFNPVCEACGKVTETVTAVDLDDGTVEYRCTDLEAGDDTVEGCGHAGTATLREGKLPWRFEWPAQWRVLGVDFEPFGKDHAEGSWPSGEAIARDVLGDDPPVPMTYEWFTLDGAPFSSSAGNVLLVSEVLDLVEPEVLRYFFTKDPGRGRDFSVERIDRLADEFDRFEARHFGESGGTDPETARAEAAYPAVIRPTVSGRFDDGCPEALLDPGRRAAIDDRIDDFAARVRLPYTFAAVLGMFESPDAREAFARAAEHLPADAPAWAVDCALDRVELASTWAERTDNAYNYRIAESPPDVAFDAATERALDDLAAVVEREPEGETIHEAVFETARDHGIEPADLFAAVYRLLFDREDGPRLGPFLADLETEFAVERLRREG
jgi:lysyl-tRNA synthetase class 1